MITPFKLLSATNCAHYFDLIVRLQLIFFPALARNDIPVDCHRNGLVR